MSREKIENKWTNQENNKKATIKKMITIFNIKIK
jgi:hypothetical protein